MRRDQSETYMKYLVIISIIVLFVVVAGNVYHGQNNTSSQQFHGNTFGPSLPGSNDPPTPTVSFTVRQQCANDANMLMNRLYQEEPGSEKQAENGGHTLQITYSLWESAFSDKLGSCVAIVNENGTTDSKQILAEEIYDTVSGKLLAQNDYTDSKNNFIPAKYNSVSNLDYLNYKTSIGL